MTGLTAELLDISRAVRRLAPDRRDPERFFVEKDEAAARLAAIARRIDPRRGNVVIRRDQQGDGGDGGFFGGY